MLRVLVLPLFLLLSSCSFTGGYDFISLVIFKRQISLEKRLEEFKNKKWNTDKPVVISWDKHAIPYIKAKTDRDLFYATGAVHAHLRGTQLELFRRLSRGRLSELVGLKTLKMDVFLRTLDVGAVSDEIISSLSPKLRSYAEAFVKGINDYNAQITKLPIDLKLMGVEKLEPWTLKDLIYVHRLMGADVNWKFWPDLVKVFNDVEEDKYSKHWKKWVRPIFSKKQMDLSVLDSISDAGSNAFAVSGEKTLSGKPIVAGDPHLGLTVPNFWFFIHQDSPSFKTLGITMPSFPFAAMGRNRHLAWTGTNMWGVSSYLYELTEKDLKNIRTRQEVFKVRFADDRLVDIIDSEWGPVISNTDFMKSSKPLAIKWVGHNKTSELESFYQANIAKNITEFKAAFKDYGVVALTYVVADKNGEISKIRVTQHPSLKIPLQNFIQKISNPIEKYYNVYDFPEIKNPEKGFVVSSNEPVYVKGEAACWLCSTGERKDRISELLSRRKMDVERVKAIHQDVQYEDAREIIEGLFKSYGNAQIRLPDDFQSLFSWNLKYSEMAFAPYLFEEILKFLAYEIYKVNQFDKTQVRLAFSHYSWRSKLISQLSDLSLDEQRGVLKEVTRKANKLRRKSWGKAHTIKLMHPFGSVPLLGMFFVLYKGSYPGSVATVFKAAFKDGGPNYKVKFGANLRVIFDLSGEDENYGVLLGGQDGFWGSEQIKDQIKLWLDGEYIKMPFTREGIVEVTKQKIIL